MENTKIPGTMRYPNGTYHVTDMILWDVPGIPYHRHTCRSLGDILRDIISHGKLMSSEPTGNSSY